jgi:Asp-tRNA(Asn)/Glu-tRNA(Gln) amidotransferase A subunit family amidase
VTPLASPATADALALATEIRAGALSAREVCASALRAAADAPQIVWELDGERAGADAAQIDAAVAAGRTETLGPLAGVPIAVKDSFDVRDLPTRGGLPAPLHRAPRDAVAVARLRAAGAIVIGKTAMDQLAWTMSGQAPGFPRLENPSAPGHVTGGSSGGSAAAVAAGIVPVALGSDTAGSIRLPAAWCGVIGVRPTPGRIPLTGVLPLAPSIDTIGVLARSPRDCATVLGALGLELTAEPATGPVGAVVLGGAAAPAWFARAIEPLLGDGGWERAGNLDALPAPSVGRILAAEFAAAWPDPAGATEELRAGVDRGRALDPASVQADRLALAESARHALSLLGDGPRLLLLPSAPGPAPALGEDVSVATASQFTRALSVLGWPSASLPCGRVDGRPVGLQLAAAPGQDAFLLTCLQSASERLDPEVDLA